MAITNYGELKTAIRVWLNRVESDVDLVPFIPDFITLAEAEMHADLDARVMEFQTDPADITPGPIALPDDYGAVQSVHLVSPDDDLIRRELPYATEKQMADFISKEGRSGDPQRYTIEGESIGFWPWGTDPQGNPQWKWTMFYRGIPKLGPDDNSTNKILQQWPNLYLYGSLQHTAPYLEEDVRLTTWTSIYNTMVEKVRFDIVMSESGTPQISMPKV